MFQREKNNKFLYELACEKTALKLVSVQNYYLPNIPPGFKVSGSDST